MSRLPGFDHEKHALYVAKGYCPEVYWTGAYCALPDGHAGPHQSLLLVQDGSLIVGGKWD